MFPRLGRRRQSDPGPPPAIRHPVLAALVEAGHMSAGDAGRALQLAEERGEPLPVILRELELLDEERWLSILHERFGIEIATAEEVPAKPVLADALSASFLRHNRVLPLAEDGEHVWLAMADPSNREVVKGVAVATGRKVVPVGLPLEVIEATHARDWDRGAGAIARIVADLDPAETAGEPLAEAVREAEEAPVVRLVDRLLEDAVRMSASDLHLEPTAERLRIRLRVHGRLRELAAPPTALGPAVVSRIKILARMDVSERRLPQDGRARLRIAGREVDLRVATMPTMHGESAVVRILDHSQRRVGLDALGLEPELERRLRARLDAPYGMLLVTGPTGSGKTTTLYAALQTLDADAAKIVSIEDPVEYQLPGVTQIQVRPEIGLEFATVLRAVLRHDPDVVMVGETRDRETAEVAIHAALTGHLLLTTLHTNTAVGAVARLLDMGVEPYLLASVLHGVLGQRLVGLLCPRCRVPVEATPEERELLRRGGIEPQGSCTLYRPGSCRACDGIGYVGRVGIFELFEIDDAVRERIRACASTQELTRLARRAGMRSMYEDGVRKCLAGLATLQDVCRVTEEW